MSLFVLREGYRVTTTDKGGRVVHVRTGDELNLTAVEVQLLARATAGGVDPDDPKLKPAIRKLANLGLLVAKDPTARPRGTVPAFDELSIELEEAAGAVASPPPAPAAPVPRFRGDLTIARRGDSNLYDVTDPKTKRTLAVYDFELSLARMLDGKRTHEAVVEAAKRVGIPVNGESLSQFSKQLGTYGFLAAPGSVDPEGGSSFPARTKWKPTVRVHFQTGLKLSREGRYRDAVLAFELVLAEDPENPEALEALAEAQRNLKGIPSPAPSPAPPSIPPVQPPSTQEQELAQAIARRTAEVATLPGAPPAAAPEPLPMPSSPSASSYELQVSLPGEDTFRSTPSSAAIDLALTESPTSPAPVTDPSSSAPVPPMADETAAARAAAAPSVVTTITERAAPAAPVAAKRGVSLPVYVASVVAALALGWFAGSRGVSEVAAPNPPGPTVIATKPPGPARDPAPIPTSATPPVPVADAGAATEPAPQVGPPVVEQADAGAQAAAAKAGPEPRADAGRAAPIEPAPGVPVAATPAGERTAARILKRGRVTMGVVEAAEAGTVTWTAARESPVKKGAVVGHLAAASGRVDLTAPKAGLFIPTAPEGAPVTPGQALASIVYVEGFIQSTVELAKPYAAWTCEVADKATNQQAPCKVVTAVPRGAGLFVTATVEPLWFDTCAAPELRLGEAR